MDKNKHITIIIPTLFLVIAIAFDGLPYGFFTVLRFVICLCSAYMAWTAYSYQKRWVAYIFGFIAILFNPILPIYLNRPLWIKIDFIVELFFLASLLFLKTAKSTERKNV